MQTLAAVLKARLCLEVHTPLKSDCGSYCDSACCRSGEAGSGMLLFPREEELYSVMPAGFSISQSSAVPGALLLSCEGTCSRIKRPLACRFFPLIPYWRGKTGGIAMDVRAWPVCLLMEDGIAGLKRTFVDAAIFAARALMAARENRDFVIRLTRHLDAYKRFDAPEEDV